MNQHIFCSPILKRKKILQIDLKKKWANKGPVFPRFLNYCLLHVFALLFQINLLE